MPVKGGLGMNSTEWKRVALLVPSSNSVMEVDFYRGVPAGVTVHTGRMFMEETTPEGESRMLDEFTMPAAEAVATARPHVLVFGCTSAGALRGNDYDALLCEELRTATGVPVVSTIASVRAAIARRGAEKVGVITPYVDSLNEKIRASLESDGVEVVGIEGMGITDNFTIAEVSPTEIAEFAERSFGGRSIDLLFASCTNLRALDALDLIENHMEVPAISSNLAALEGTLEALGLGADIAPRRPEALSGARDR
jgi:maleate isomerase